MRHPRKTSGRLGDRPDNYRNLRALGKKERPDTDKNDNGYVHYNSCFIDNAAVLMLEGGTNDTSKLGVEKGVGWEKATKLWWKTQRHLLTRKSTIHRLARAQIAITRRSKHAIVPEAVACGWAATDAVSPEWLLGKFKIRCPDATICKGLRDGGHCDAEPDTIVHCGSGKVTDRSSCPTAQCTIIGGGEGAECPPPPPPPVDAGTDAQ